MESELEQLENKWGTQFINIRVSENDILSFQNKYNLILPNDLKTFFLRLNGTNEKYDENFFQFFSIEDFKSIDAKLKNKRGSPDYSNITNTFNEHKTSFVFADFEFYLFSYAIQLYENKSFNNEIYVICGDEYKKIANSFTGFLELYLDDPKN